MWPTEWVDLLPDSRKIHLSFVNLSLITSANPKYTNGRVALCLSTYLVVVSFKSPLLYSILYPSPTLTALSPPQEDSTIDLQYDQRYIGGNENVTPIDWSYVIVDWGVGP